MNNEPPFTPAPPASAWWRSNEKVSCFGLITTNSVFPHKQIPGLMKQHYKLEMLSNKYRTNSLSEQGNAGLTQNKVTRTLRAELRFTCKYDSGGDGLCKTLDRDRSHTFYDRNPWPVIKRRYRKTWAKYSMREKHWSSVAKYQFQRISSYNVWVKHP